MNITRSISALVLAAGVSSLAQIHTASATDGMRTNDHWWPNRLDLSALRDNSPNSSPLDEDFNYADAFSSLDLDAVKQDLIEVMTTSQDWWPADYGHYGPFFIRMAWHSAGTYRVSDGRGGSDGGFQRFAPLNSWPDNANLDKAQRLLTPIKQKYGRALSWGDLMVLAGTVAMESMGFKTYGFAGGRVDAWEPEIVNWGSEDEWLAANRRDSDGRLKKPFGATQMGLIYVNPEGPGGNPDPKLAAQAIREAFGRMAMNDEETIALIAGGHTFGKAHGAHKPSDCVGAEPEAEGLEAQGLGWMNKCGSGSGSDTVTSGLEGAWTVSPAQWTHNYLQNLYGFEWVKSESPAGAIQWIPADGAGAGMVPDAHDPNKRHAPIMFTTDLALKVDPEYRKITSRWLENPAEFEDAFAKAWFKLTHRDLGPRSRYLGKYAPKEDLIWQDPIPTPDYKPANQRDIKKLKKQILNSGLTTSELVRTAWASAATYRNTDMRGGANGGRIRLAPAKDWEVNQPAELAKVLRTLEDIQREFNSKRKRISMADLIVLGGAAAIESAALKAGHDIEVPFTPGRGDATQEQTDIEAFHVLELKADGFRNYYAEGNDRSPVDALIDKADVLSLSIPEMTVLVGGMRVLGANYDNSKHGVFTDNPGILTNDFFVNLVDMSYKWTKAPGNEGIYEARDRSTGELKWTGTPVDLIFGSNSELRAITDFYASDDAKKDFVDDFVKAWSKVMTLDRFELSRI